MVSTKLPQGWLVRLDHKEELVRSLTDFCVQKEIGSAWITGVGGAQWAELAFYHLETKAYEYDQIDEPLEVTSLNGNVTLLNGKPFLHLHATVGDMNYHSYSGHVKELAVGATFEVKIDVFDEPINRVHSDANGLKILDLK